ncbi:MAG: HAMP domain-containing histidine kinase [Microbacteriaceae bacterium]|nr:HAMP domain-containing histidine kinase [Microbacteriaceae bacterium]
MPRWLDPRAWWRGMARLWRSSLALRTVALTIGLSLIATLGVGIAIDLGIRQSMLEVRRAQLVTLSQSATFSAQRSFNDSAAQGGLDDAVLTDGVRLIQNTTATTSGQTSFALVLAPGQNPPVTSAALASPGLEAIFDRVVSAELRASLEGDAEGRVFSQSAGIPSQTGPPAPAIVTGSTLEIQGVRYQLYLIYDISDTAEVLSTIQLALLGAGFALILLIAAVALLVVRLTVGPVQVAAATSRRLAAGELDVRLPVKGDDVIATLARSFNGMADSLKGQITRLAELSTVQQRFVSDVSHELRTPLTTIRLAGDVLRDRTEQFDPATARTVELMHTQIQRFEGLLSDLLEMSRFDAGAVEMEVDRINVARLAEDTVAAMTPLAEAKGSELLLIAEGGHFEADADARRIRRIVSNLIGNAIDHGEGRPIEVWVDSDQNAAAIAVRDHGVGIAVEDLDRVFDRFWRADPSRQRTTGGSGLGLAISLEDAALHGGWLEAWSAPGEGSCFRLTIPRRHGGRLTSSPLALPPETPPESLASGPVRTVKSADPEQGR